VDDVADMIGQFSQPQFWVAVLQIIWINILLSGDNAVVIAMACRGLPPRERMWGMIIGAGVASVLLIVFTGVVSALMMLPFLRLISACALLYIAVKLVGPQDEDAEGTQEAVDDLWRAVWIVVVADIIMSLDNVVAVAAVANGRYVLLGLGLAISIPVVIAGSAAILALLERFPIIVWAGGAVLGWVAGELFVSDPVLASRLSAIAQINIDLNSALTGAAQHSSYQMSLDLLDVAAGTVGALLVLIVGSLWRKHVAGSAAEEEQEPAGGAA
jgi:YjbE family integral membrane protein